MPICGYKYRNIIYECCIQMMHGTYNNYHMAKLNVTQRDFTGRNTK